MQKGLAPILVVLLLAVISVGGVIIYWNQNRSTASAPQIIKTTPTPTPDPTTSWKTYVNKKINYSFKYPSNYELQEVSTPNVELVNLIKEGVIEIIIEVVSVDVSLDEILSTDRGIVKTIFSNEITLGGIRAVQERVIEQAAGGTVEGEAIYAVKDNRKIRIIYSDKVKDDLELFLTTFKFL